ncbi:PREDICTED: LOW QUALITY PROTEIN: cytochrome P450 4C1-like [Atta cephalotes]|uniref:Cytochrome P450 n=1 Tax=Atta cephalotes TaxID=12957 RepID=A0A158NVN9_ATTCE|nr:PREDICTED: LOW QUALITY PROTEIN: cytochrome P450 4C1-like [Atta cephalotes]
MTFIFEVNKNKFYKLKKNLEFIISLPGASIFSSLVDSLQVACNYKELIDCIDAVIKKYGNLTRVIVGTDIFIVLTKPEDYKLVLTNVNGNYKSSVTQTWEAILGDGIIRASGVSHKLRRKIIHPLMNIKYISEYITFFDSNFCTDILEKNVDGPMFDLKPYIAQYVFNIFLVTTVGIQGIAHKDERDILHKQKELFKDAYSKVIKPWLRLNWIFFTKNRKQMCIAQNTVLDFIYNISPRKPGNYTALQYNNYNMTIIQELKPIFYNYYDRVEQIRVNASNKSYDVSDENFLDDIRNFFAAIQNTITEATSFIMLMLAIHTDVQEKLRQEILVTFNNDKIDVQRLLSMRYLYMVFQETLRLFPVVPLISRQLTGDIKLESCTLPEGCYVMIPIFAIHRNPMYWYKPLEFIPERFSSTHHRYTYIPFGVGLRDCVGQKYAFLFMATIIVNLLRRFRFVTVGNLNDVKTTTDIVLRLQHVKMSIFRI